MVPSTCVNWGRVLWFCVIRGNVQFLKIQTTTYTKELRIEVNSSDFHSANEYFYLTNKALSITYLSYTTYSQRTLFIALLFHSIKNNPVKLNEYFSRRRRLISKISSRLESCIELYAEVLSNPYKVPIYTV